MCLFKALLVLLDDFGCLLVFDCLCDCSIVLVETVEAELFAKFGLLIVHIQKGFDDVRETESFGFGIDRCDVVFGVWPSSILDDCSYFFHQFCEYFGLGAGRDEIIRELLTLGSIPVEHDDRGGSQLAAEC